MTAVRRWMIASALVGLTLGASLVLGRDAHEIEGDPAGTKACRTLADWTQGYLGDPDSGRPLDRAIATRQILGQAAGSGMPAVRAAASLPALREACAAAGMPMPPYAEPSTL